MKPFRMRMTHNLVAAYGMLDKMQVLVRRACGRCDVAYFAQRPRRAEPLQMAAFHTDEYVDFLGKVTPETAEELTGGGQRCTCAHSQRTSIHAAQTCSENSTTPHLTAFSSSVRFTREAH